MKYRTLEWLGDENGFLRIIDQTLLPNQLAYIDLRTVEEVWEAIRSLRVRGAPAIGIAAAYGAILGLQESSQNAVALGTRLARVCDYLGTSRPTAVNLFAALDRLQEAFQRQVERVGDVQELRRMMFDEARSIHDEDREMCRAIGEHGAGLVPDGGAVLTHCNAGALATSEWGTALAPLYLANQQGKKFTVYVDETRPLLQGARLTAWELAQAGIETVLICDNMAGQVLREGRIQLVIVGADRIAANGDTANKIGTYGLAVLAHNHGVPLYVAAPSTTFDLALTDGTQIPIEQRAAAEITHFMGKSIAPVGIRAYNPAFDVTPARLITGIVTERGIIRPVTASSVRAHFCSPG
jgi:methylthioribose-1-phosphate isomerase